MYPPAPRLTGFAQFNFPICLAPMVGLSHLPMRRLLRQYMPKGARTLWPTEMLNSRRLPHERVGSTLETLRDDDEVGLVPQILANQEKYIAASLVKLTAWGADGIDINMGCPVRKALRHNYGVSLMGDPTYACEVVAMTVAHTSLPVSVKLRSGYVHDPDFLLKFVGGLVDAGAAWLTIHPRLAQEGRRGRARWEELALIKRALTVPVIGNGDVQTVQDFHLMRDKTACDLVMVGRALTARPWLFWQVAEDLGWGPPPGRLGQRAPRSAVEEGAEYGRALAFLLDQFVALFPEALGVRRFQFFVRTGCPWLMFGQQFYGLVNRCRGYVEVAEVLRQFFSRPQEMQQKTSFIS